MTAGAPGGLSADVTSELLPEERMSLELLQDREVTGFFLLSYTSTQEGLNKRLLNE